MNNAHSSHPTTIIPGFRAFFALAALTGLASACHSADSDRSPPQQPMPEAGPVDAGITKFCDLPGSVQSTKSGTVSVPGSNTSQVSFLHLPVGFCAHYFGNVPNTRQLRLRRAGSYSLPRRPRALPVGGPTASRRCKSCPTTTTTATLTRSKPFCLVCHRRRACCLRTAISTIKTARRSCVSLIIRVTARRLGQRSRRRYPGIFLGIALAKVLDQADDGTIYVGNGGTRARRAASRIRSRRHPQA